jgi:hypothetical protein
MSTVKTDTEELATAAKNVRKDIDFLDNIW